MSASILNVVLLQMTMSWHVDLAFKDSTTLPRGGKEGEEIQGARLEILAEVNKQTVRTHAVGIVDANVRVGMLIYL